MRPVPLFTAPELLTLLEPHPLTDDAGIHGQYVGETLTGRVLVVAGSESRRDRLVAFAEQTPGVCRVVGRVNAASTHEDVEATDLGAEDLAPFDTIVYAKETATWLGRSPDFQALTPLLETGGTLLTKCKWVPDSDRLRLKEIAVAGAYSFELPEVYLRFVREQATLTEAFASDPTEEGADDAATAATGVAADGGTAAQPPACAIQANRELVEQTREWESPFQFDGRKTAFTPGWSWHSALTEHVRERVDGIDGRVANVCCGVSELGDVRVDQLTEWTDTEGVRQPTGATVQGDAMSLPLATNAVAGAVSDPPWKVPVDERVRLFSELQRIVEPGGVVIQNSWWIPHHPYAMCEGIRPVTANVTDDSTGGPGGLSFLTEYEVLEQPGHETCPYTLADHMERHGREHLDAYRGWGWSLAKPGDQPANDPRVLGGVTECPGCAAASFSTWEVHGRPLYECVGCGFRWDAHDLLTPVSGSGWPDGPGGPRPQ